MIYRRIFFIIFTFFLNEIKEKKVQSAVIEKLPNEILENIFDHSSIISIENLRYVCRRFYVLSYQYFGIGPKVIDLFSFEKPKNDSPILRYRPFHTSYQLKKMFSIFLNSPPNIENHVKLAQIENFQFEPDSIPSLFQQAMLERYPAKKDTLFQKGVKLLELKQNQDDYPVAKDFLTICYRHGLGVDQNEKQAETLEDEVSSYLHTQLHQPWFPWSFQLWMEPISTQWFESGNTALPLPIEKAKKLLDSKFLYRGPYFRSHTWVDFVKNFLKSDSTLKAISSFLENNKNSLPSRFELCKLYLSLLIECGLIEKPWPSIWIENDYSKKKCKAILPILTWLDSKLMDEKLPYQYSTTTTLFQLQTTVEYLDTVIYFFEGVDSISLEIFENPHHFKGKAALTSWKACNTYKKNLETNLSMLFNNQEENDEDIPLLQKLKIAEIFEIFSDQNWKFIKSSIQNWLKSEKTHTQIQNKMLEENFFKKVEWLDYHHIVMHSIKKNREIFEKVLDNAFKNTDNAFDQIRLGQYLNQLGKFSISHLEIIKNHLKKILLIKKQSQSHQEFYMLERCLQIECYQLQLFEKEINHFLSENLEDLTLVEALRQLRIVSLCANSGDRKLHALIDRQWMNLKKIRLFLKKIQMWKVNFPKKYKNYFYQHPQASNEIWTCL